ncbi:NAD(P)-dependent oxidoreductase [Aestuariirhabdus sp. Z084]|uniref:NAD(P)-dependent oxidoreductase n=1 Tax=Aestuariirhabdus haliotis TaxID=2918751 RepID=UPI00201B427C|nr:NAD(P)-dependent oxidoreductase [Aestuariirhabdus haliotis]MCL6416692.1 NAD(P)-dependent oxidoreductase [Aestuariirhabdus haliotis]MCL6420719.1 NAD(P)-dependent oxidoreductase [Aestuariirhabdus haliotis]
MKTVDRLGFIGTGLMGSEMVPHLLRNGFDVAVWNRTPAKLEPLLSLGAQSKSNLSELVDCSDIILMCLSDTEAVETVVFGPQGVSSRGRPDQLLVDFSSIEPEKTQHFSQRLQQACGMSWVDCPVSGGVVGAREASLVMMVGGADKDIQRALPVVDCLSERVTHMGGVGSGQLTKVCNQMIVGCNAMVIAEMIALATKGGVDAEKIPQALAGGFADSKPLQILGPQMATSTFEPIAWHVRTLLKDLHIAQTVAHDNNSRVPMSAEAFRLMQEHADQGYSEQDPATLIRLYLEEA